MNTYEIVSSYRIAGGATILMTTRTLTVGTDAQEAVAFAVNQIHKAIGTSKVSHILISISPSSPDLKTSDYDT